MQGDVWYRPYSSVADNLYDTMTLEKFAYTYNAQPGAQ